MDSPHALAAGELEQRVERRDAVALQDGRELAMNEEASRIQRFEFVRRYRRFGNVARGRGPAAIRTDRGALLSGPSRSNSHAAPPVAAQSGSEAAICVARVVSARRSAAVN
jgi:hypothetical protein